MVVYKFTVKYVTFRETIRNRLSCELLVRSVHPVPTRKRFGSECHHFVVRSPGGRVLVFLTRVLNKGLSVPTPEGSSESKLLDGEDNDPGTRRTG